MKVITNGRTDFDDYFRLSGIREHAKLSHTPFLVFVIANDGVEVEIVESATKLLQFPDDTQVMPQWSGDWRSDFFQFTVRDLRQFIANNPPESYDVV